ncbi:MAG: fatty acid--CoA ligase [Candidatus Abyssubacteria bacterium]|nr:fatty acid--CoA ligase [Candidatus Abyssubacteria bacterium]
MLLGDLVRRNGKLFPDNTAAIFEGRRFTWREFDERVNRLANALIGLGIKREDHVAILAKNCNEYLEMYFACARNGSICTALNYRLSSREMHYVIDNSEAKVVIVSDEFLDTLEDIRPDLKMAEHYIVIGQTPEGMKSYDDLISEASPEPPGIERHEDDVVLQMYTSGTTGLPKGAMLTHRSLLTIATGCSFGMQFQAGDCILMVAPLYHMAAGMTSLATILQAGPILLHRDFNPVAILDDMEGGEVTTVLLIPVMLNFLLQMPDIEKRDFSNIRAIVYGASPMPVEVLRKGMEIFQCDFVQGYGQTESSAVLSILNAEDHVLDGTPEQLKRLGSAGREVFGTEVRVIDENGNDVKPGQIGEVIGRGENVMKGYWKMPEATAEAIRDGWLYTGDLATVDEDGYIYILDRMKDMIISGGENVYSREVEEVLYEHPAIAEAAVIGVPDEQWGETVKAIVVLKEGQEASAEEIIDFSRERLAGFKRPRSVDLVDSLPRNLSGKVLKKILREPYWRDRERQV